MSLAVGTIAVNAAVGASAYILGTEAQNAFDVPNGETPIPITLEGAVLAGALNGAAGAIVQPLPTEGMRTIAQAGYFAPGRTLNSIASEAASRNIYLPLFQSGTIASFTSSLIQPYVKATADGQCIYDDYGRAETTSCALNGGY